MVFSVEQMDGATAELAMVASAEGKRFDNIRIMTVSPTSDKEEKCVRVCVWWVYTVRSKVGLRR